MLHILICYWLMHHPMFIVLLNEVCQDFAKYMLKMAHSTLQL